MNNRMVINFVPGTTFLHRLNGATKVMLFIACTVYVIMTFDIRVLLPMLVIDIVAIASMRPNWKPILFMYGFMFVTVGIWGSILLFLVAPEAGLSYVGQEDIIVRFTDYFYISKEFLWYVFITFVKRSVSFTVVIVFVLSITPSELAAGLNYIGLPYKVCTIVSLAFRTIPDVARDFVNISNSMQMRGVELNAKRTTLYKRLKQSFLMIVPLALSSFAKVGNIANAMDLRGYGREKRRSWYSENEATKADYVFRVLAALLFAFCLFYIVYFRVINPWPAKYWYPWPTFPAPW